MPCCRSAPLLLYVTRQQNLREYWREGSTSTARTPTSASDSVGQHTEIGVTCRRAEALLQVLTAAMKNVVSCLCVVNTLPLVS